MTSSHSARLVVILAVSALACATVILGCETQLGPLRATTMPPDLSYLPPEQIRTAMWVLAAEIGELERLLETPGPSNDSAKQSAVRAHLARMRVAAETLDVPGKTTQHPVLNQNLDRFLTRLRHAEQAVDRDPPNYFPATTIAGSCFVCHGQTVGGGRQSAGRQYAGTMQSRAGDARAQLFSFDSRSQTLQRSPKIIR